MAGRNGRELCFPDEEYLICPTGISIFFSFLAPLIFDCLFPSWVKLSMEEQTAEQGSFMLHRTKRRSTLVQLLDSGAAAASRSPPSDFLSSWKKRTLRNSSDIVTHVGLLLGWIKVYGVDQQHNKSLYLILTEFCQV